MKRKEVPDEIKAEIAEIFGKIKQYDEAKEVGIKLISKLKSETEGRGVVPQAAIDRLRKAFDYLTTEEE